MATYNWTALTNGLLIVFNPLDDVLDFDDAAIGGGGHPGSGKLHWAAHCACGVNNPQSARDPFKIPHECLHEERHL
ncbi:MAG: hypothetical protein ACRD88_00495 [Terriglobia bacterium]